MDVCWSRVKYPHRQNISDTKIADFVAGVLADVWIKVDVTSVVVTTYNGGQAFGKTYKVLAPGMQPESVAFHLMNNIRAKDELYRMRMDGIIPLLYSENLCPRRLCHGHDWFVEIWEGYGSPASTPENLVEMAQLMANIHKIPPNWFDKCRSRLRERNPIFLKVPDSDSLWWITCLQRETMEIFHKKTEVEIESILDFSSNLPWTDASRRLVTIHGDFHRGNIIQTEEGMKCIDMDFTCVSFAGYDIAVGVHLLCPDDHARRLFLESYLREMGDSCEPTDVENLLFDSHVCLALTHLSALPHFLVPDGKTSTDEAISLLATAKTFVALAKGSPELRAAVIAHGLVGAYIQNTPAQKMPRRGRQAVREGVGLYVSRIASAGPHHHFVFNWDGTVQPYSADVWRGLVLGVDPCDGTVVLTSYCNESHLLRVVIHAGLSVTGIQAPTSPAIELFVSLPRKSVNKKGDGVDTRGALVLSSTGRYKGFVWESTCLGPRANAVRVHFENGLMRLVDRPYKALDCSMGQYHEGNPVVFWFAHGGKSQKFVLNSDKTVSPEQAPGVVLGHKRGGGEELALVCKQSSRALVFETLVETKTRGLVPSLRRALDFATSAIADTIDSFSQSSLSSRSGVKDSSFPLILSSHPGLAICIEEGGEVPSGTSRLVVGPAEEALRVSCHTNFWGGGGCLLKVSGTEEYVHLGCHPSSPSEAAPKPHPKAASDAVVGSVLKDGADEELWCELYSLFEDTVESNAFRSEIVSLCSGGIGTVRGRVEYVGCWIDRLDSRTFPMAAEKLSATGVGASANEDIAHAFVLFIAALRVAGVREGHFAVQCGGEVYWSLGPDPERTYGQHGRAGSGPNLASFGRIAQNISVPGFSGCMSDVGGALQNCVYRVTLL